jgi:hypothetical protein
MSRCCFASLMPATDALVSVRYHAGEVEFVAISVGDITLQVSVHQADRIRDEIAAAFRRPLELEEVNR